MTSLFRRFVYQFHNMLGRHRAAVITLCAVVVFCTTYILILPAFTLDSDRAAEAGGIDLPATTQEETAESVPDDSDEPHAAYESDEHSDAPGKSEDSPNRDASAANRGSASGDGSGQDSLTTSGGGYTITITPASDSGLDPGTRVETTLIDETSDEYSDYYRQAVSAACEEHKLVTGVEIYDISLVSSDAAIQPNSPVDVTIAYDKAARLADGADANDVRIVHFARTDKGGDSAELLDSNDVDPVIEDGAITETTFRAESFSVYAVVYTVDFHYNADGAQYDLSIPGGGFVSLKDLLSSLHASGKIDVTPSVQSETDGSVADALLSEIRTVDFSDPSLVSVSRVDSDTTIGEIKKNLRLDCEYSSSLTEDEIEDINNSKIAKGDWAVVALHPFATDETLTLTMHNGDTIIIDVTDAQYDVHIRINDTNAGVFNSKYYGIVNENGIDGTSYDGTSKNSSPSVLNYGFGTKPNSGYRFVYWVKNNSEELESLNNKTEVNGVSTFDGYFAPSNAKLIRYKIEGSGTLSGGRSFTSYDGTRYYSYSSDAAGATAVGNTGYVIDYWEYEGKQYTGATFDPSLVSSDCVVTAHFRAADRATITYEVSPSGWGNLTRVSEQVYEGATALGSQATPAATNRYFVAWVDSDNQIVSYDQLFRPSGSQVYNGARYTAVFAQVYDRIALSVNNSDYGYIGGSGNWNNNNYLPNTTNNYVRADFNGNTLRYGLTAYARDGYEFDYWELNGHVLNDGSSLDNTFSSIYKVAGLNKLVAYFRPEGSYKITYEAAEHGSVTLNSEYISNTIEASGSTAIPESDDYVLDGWYIGDRLISRKATLTSDVINMDTITGDTVMTARFKEKPPVYKFIVRTEYGDDTQGYLTSNAFTGQNLSSFNGTGQYRPEIDDTGISYFQRGINAVAQEGYSFAFWLDDEGTGYSKATLPNTTVIPHDNTVFTAYFTSKGKFLIMYRAEANGSVSKDRAYSDEEGAVATPQDGYLFTGWYDQDGNIVSMNPSFDNSLATRSLVLTAKFRAPGAANFTVAVNDPSMGDVKFDGGRQSYLGARASNEDGTLHNTITATPDEGHVFLGWTITRDGSTFTLPIQSAAISAGDTSLVLQAGDVLTANFGKPTDVGSGSGGAEGIDISDEEKEALKEWLASLQKDSSIQAEYKTASVGVSEGDYSNRIYKIDIGAESSIMDLASSIDLGFILDASNSMLFPSRLVSTEKTMVLTQDNLDKAFPNASTNDKYYIISDPSGTSTVYRIFRNANGKWCYTDASKSEENVISWNGMERYAEKTTAAPYSFTIYEDGDEGKQRLDYLREGIGSTLTTLRKILANAGREGNTTSEIRIASNTFAYQVLTSSHNFTTLTSTSPTVTVPGTEGGTRQDLALQDAVEFDWTSIDNTSARRYAILITDGASVYSSSSPDKDGIGKNVESIRENVVTQANALKTKGVTLITIGLSTKNVDGGSQLLYDIADDIDGERQFYEAEAGDDLEAILLQIMQTIMRRAEVKGTVTDTIDPAFYPVNQDGTLVPEGYYVDVGANPGADDHVANWEYWADLPTTHSDLQALINTEAPFYRWSKDNSGKWTITWYNQTIGWNEDHKNWHDSIYVKAREDFLGGNTISTNSSASITPEAFRVYGNGTPTQWISYEEEPTTLDTPYVNVDELSMNSFSTTWTVYLGTSVSPEDQLKEMLKELEVSKVVSASGVDNRRTADSKLKGEDGFTAEKVLLTSITGELTADQWNTLTETGRLTIDYNKYDDSRFGTDHMGKIVITLTKTGSDTYGAHNTAAVGTPAETYELKVEYQPSAPVTTYTDSENKTQSLDYHTTAGGSAGDATDNITSTNSHVINVFAKGISITKMDQTFENSLTGAEFVLYRTVRTGDDQSRVTSLSGVSGNYFPVTTLDMSSSNTANINNADLPVLRSGEQHYLVETRAPAGYYMLTTPIPVDITVTDSYTPVPNGSPQNEQPASGLYNRTETATLVVGDGSTSGKVRRVTSDSSGDQTHAGIVADSASDTVYYQIANDAGIELPATGGTGTEILRVIGFALLILAAILHIAKNQRRTNQ